MAPQADRLLDKFDDLERAGVYGATPYVTIDRHKLSYLNGHRIHTPTVRSHARDHRRRAKI